MMIEIALFNSKNNTIIKTQIVNKSYIDSELYVKEVNKKQKNSSKYWKVLNINV